VTAFIRHVVVSIGRSGGGGGGGGVVL